MNRDKVIGTAGQQVQQPARPAWLVFNTGQQLRSRERALLPFTVPKSSRSEQRIKSTPRTDGAQIQRVVGGLFSRHPQTVFMLRKPSSFCTDLHLGS